MQVGAEHVVDVAEAQAGGGKAVEPRLLGEVHRWRIALVLAGAGIDQDGVLGRAHHVGLVGNDHLARYRIENFRIKLGQMAFADRGVVSRKHFLRPPPRPVAFDDAGDGDVADRELFHDVVMFPSIRPAAFVFLFFPRPSLAAAGP